jgi:hypothetical protein
LAIRKLKKRLAAVELLALTVDHRVRVAAAVVISGSAIDLVVPYDAIDRVYCSVISWAAIKVVISYVAGAISKEPVRAVLSKEVIASVLSIDRIISGSAKEVVVAFGSE